MRSGTAFHRNAPRYYVAVVFRTRFTGWTGFFPNASVPHKGEALSGSRVNIPLCGKPYKFFGR